MAADTARARPPAHLVLTALFLACTAAGVLYNRAVQTRRKLAGVSCQNRLLWAERHLEGQASCPLTPDMETSVVYWNNESLPSGSQLIASLVAKVNVKLAERVIFGLVQVDAALITLDKQTHQVVHKQFTAFSKDHGLRFQKSTHMSQEVHVLATQLRPEHYYRLEVYDLRVFHDKYDHRLRIEYFKNKKFLANALFSTSEFGPSDLVRRFQQPAFYALLALFLYFAYRLLAARPHKLLDPYAWLAILSSASAALYLYPGRIAGFDLIYRFVLFQFVFASSLDWFVFGKSLPSPLNSLFPFVAGFFNLLAAAFSLLGTRDLRQAEFAVVNQTRNDLYTEYQYHLSKIAFWKCLFHVAALAFAFAFRKRLPRAFRHLLPVWLAACAWIKVVAKDDGPYAESNSNPASLAIDFAFVPLAVLLLQMTALDCLDYLGLAVHSDSPPLCDRWPFALVRQKLGLKTSD